MLRIEIDMFSGRPNPVWIITDLETTRELLGAVGGARGVVARPGAGFSGLGYREVRVSIISDDEPRPRGVPRQFALASTAAADLEASGALARGLIESMTRYADVQLVQHALTPLDTRLRDVILERLARFLRRPPKVRIPRPPKRIHPLRTTIADAKCETCR
jgi:hypothetical protein